jgi:hypothetical protein
MRFSSSKVRGAMYFDFTNVLNHGQPNDPALSGIGASTWSEPLGSAAMSKLSVEP